MDIVLKRRQGEELQGQRLSVGDFVRHGKITRQGDDRSRRQHGGMKRAQQKRLNELNPE